MAVTLEGGFPVLSNQGSTTLGITQSITVGAGANRLLVLFVAFESTADTFSAVAYGAQSLTQDSTQNSGGSFARVECWRLIAPTTATANVVCTKSGSNAGFNVAIYTFDGADQTTPLRTAAKSGATTGTSTSDTVAAFASGDYTVDILSLDSTGHLPAVVGGNMTADYTAQNHGAGTSESIGAHNTTTGVMGWTWTTTGPNAHLATAVIPVAATTTLPPPIRVIDTAVARSTNW